VIWYFWSTCKSVCY